MYNRNIPVIIISAGIGNFIEKFLIDNNCYFDNIYLISNYNLFSIGFLEDNISNNIKYFQETFDIVATENSSFNDIKIKILKR